MRHRFASVPYEHPGTLVPRLARPFGPYRTLIDVGGGTGICGMPEWSKDGIVSFDVLDVFLTTEPPRGARFTLGDAREVVAIYGRRSFDVVLCTEVVEHLPKSDGLKLLQDLRSIARRCVVVTTPYGFMHHDPADCPGEPWAKNPYQKHLSGFLPEELEAIGYEGLLNGGNADGTGGQIVAWADVRAELVAESTTA